MGRDLHRPLNPMHRADTNADLLRDLYDPRAYSELIPDLALNVG